MFTSSLPLVLLVEDSPDDIDFARRALATSGIAHRLVVAEVGDEALDFLFSQSGSSADRPALVILDLNIPGIPGRDVLARIKAEPRLSSIPVVILSTSVHSTDVANCYRLHTNSYHQKPDDAACYQISYGRSSNTG
jgi:two-component system response regulator